MERFILAYLLSGILVGIIHCYKKDEHRLHVALAVVTGWPLFLIAYLGSGWNELLNKEEDV